MSDQVKMLHSVVSLDYERPPTLVAREYMEAIRQHRLIAHKCPECERIYTPPRGYCPICVVPTDKEHEVELSPQGTLVTYT
ncbi:MAG: Zn-ribbon domain-containing OB-fold protein, partial [Actinomycetota bacterium]